MTERENNKIQQNRLGGLIFHIPPGVTIPLCRDFDFRTDVKIKDNFGRTFNFCRITPLIKEQSIPPFIVHWGGGRTYGGGSSKDAMRRARKQRR